MVHFLRIASQFAAFPVSQLLLRKYHSVFHMSTSLQGNMVYFEKMPCNLKTVTCRTSETNENWLLTADFLSQGSSKLCIGSCVFCHLKVTWKPFCALPKCATFKFQCKCSHQVTLYQWQSHGTDQLIYMTDVPESLAVHVVAFSEVCKQQLHKY